jgi:hypothetical protein
MMPVTAIASFQAIVDARARLADVVATVTLQT